MPEMDGITTTQKALSIQPDLKFIALSMYSDKKYYYEMIIAGSKGFVLKHASVDELETAVREVFSGSNYFSKELLHSVLVDLQNTENKIAKEEENLPEFSEREMELYRKNSGLLKNLNLILPRITGSKHLCFANLIRTSILTYICHGMSNKELANKLCLSVKTIECNKAKLMKKQIQKIVQV